MKWTTRNRLRGYKSEMEGGHHNPEWAPILRDFPQSFRRIRNVKQMPPVPKPVGRSVRPEPRTIPWLVALPLLAWLWMTGGAK